LIHRSADSLLARANFDTNTQMFRRRQASDAHLAAKIQRECAFVDDAGDAPDLTAASTGTPDAIARDRRLGSHLASLIGGAGNGSSDSCGGDALAHALAALQHVASVLTSARTPLGEARRHHATLQRTLAAGDSLLAHCAATVTSSASVLDAALRSDSELLGAPVAPPVAAATHQRGASASARRTAPRAGAGATDATTTNPPAACLACDAHARELRAAAEREEKLLVRLRDAEVDLRVKAHIVAETTASARSVFDENAVLRDIARHNQQLLREVDALKRCVAENEALNQVIAVKQRAIDSMAQREREMRDELRALRQLKHPAQPL
jgi:hypothetical protein